jgi:hypothetical protein
MSTDRSVSASSPADYPIEGRIYTDKDGNQFVWKKVPINPKTGKPYPLSHEVGKRGGKRVAELIRKGKSMETEQVPQQLGKSRQAEEYEE